MGRQSSAPKSGPLQTRLFGFQFLLDAHVACAYPPRAGNYRALPAIAREGVAGRPRVAARNQADGFRIMARRDGNGVRLYTRNGHDFALLGRTLILVIVKRHFARGGRELPVVRCGP
jgi:hypothetical protein